jgi:hypothetical protein
MKALIILLAAVAVIFVSGCIANQSEESNGTEIGDISEEVESPASNFSQNLAVVECTNICSDALSLGINLTNGPCLSDNSTNWDVSDWACDVVNTPRQNSDNLAQNKCLAFVNGTAHHFVEVDLNCIVIRSV